jgi:hypothetical protein
LTLNIGRIVLQDPSISTDEIIAGSHRIAACVPIFISAWPFQTREFMRISLRHEAIGTTICVALISLPTAFVNICVCAVPVVAKNVCSAGAKQKT